MKPRSLRFFPRTLVVCVAPLLACASASASVVEFDEANATNVWTLPAGTNLLVGATVTSGGPVTHESSSGSWATLTDGILGAPGSNPQVVTPNNNDSVTYALDLTSSPAGFDITAFDSYATWGDSGRDNQNYSLQVSPDGISYYTVKVVNNSTNNPNKATHTSLTDTSPGSVMAKSVKYVRVLFGNPTGQENGYVGMSELHLQGTPSNVVTVNESNATNVWTLPAGTNLLNGLTASPLSTVVHEFSSPNWSTVTNGLLGVSNDPPSSVTPNNDTSVIFPLNLSVNFNGYNISSLDTYCAWANSGRDNQDLAISYSTVAFPDDFIPLGTAVIHTGSDSATHVKLTPVTGFLATGVAKIKFVTFSQENGYVGLREFIALGTAVSISDPLTWTGGTDGNWNSSPDSNWKKTIGGATSPFTSLAALTFDNTGANPNITVAAPLTASSMEFTSGAYTFGGGLVTVSNDIVSSGAGSATFNNAMKATTGVTQSGSGSLVFNGALESAGLVLSGSGGIITLNAANPALTGTAAVSDGTLTVSNNSGLQSAGLSMTGGTALFTTSAPSVSSIASPVLTPGSIILGNTSGPVNTNLSVGDAASVSIFGGSISEASGATGSLTKTGASSLFLSGTNSYTGTTTVSGGLLQLTQQAALYNGNSAAWTASNLVVGSGGTLGFNVGDVNEFTEADLNTAISLGGFQAGSTLGIKTYSDTTFSQNLPPGGPGLTKTGSAILTLTGTNTSTGLTTVIAGTINAASTGGTSIGGNVQIGNGTTNPFLNMGANNQFGPNSVVTFANSNFYNATMNLRGTSQTIAGLDAAPFPANKIVIVQNDETSHPGYVGDPGPASLTINATTDHSFMGIIRNQNGGPLSLIKNGLGTQELINISVQGYGYTGPTSVNAGTLKINFAGGNTGFSSNITVASGATLAFNAVGGDYNFDREIHGAGAVTAKGTNAIRFNNPQSSFTGGLTIGSPEIASYNGFVAFVAQNGVVQGQGTGLGQTCIGGAMIPSNVITIQGGATLALDGIAPLGESGVLPQYAPSIVVNHSGLRGGGLAFVPNLTLNHAEVTVGNGMAIAGFDTSLCFVGTVTVGGDSNLPSTIVTPTPGATANISLGSAGLPGTTFNVTDVTGSDAVDLNVDAVIRNVNGVISSLTKTGLGTMAITKTNTYTGTTRVSAGTLRVVSSTSTNLADSSAVVIDATGTLDLQFSGADTVSTLKLSGTQVAAGFYGSTTNSTPGITQTSLITGPGMLYVSTSPVTDPYLLWAAQITSGDSSRTGDPDGDGFNNLQEYLFGTSPNTATGSLSTSESTPSGLVVRWNERATGTSVYVLQESTDLATWSNSSAGVSNDSPQNIPDYTRKQALVPVDSAKKFVRVQATE